MIIFCYDHLHVRSDSGKQSFQYPPPVLQSHGYGIPQEP